MKVIFEKYDPSWSTEFERIKADLTAAIGFVNPVIEHIGSTSVEGLSAKPIIDVLVGLTSADDLDRMPERLMDKGYVYYEKYNEYMPYRRFFVKHDVDHCELRVPSVIAHSDEIPDSTEEHSHRVAHIHIMPLDNENWTRHIAFRDYLRTHPAVRDEYQRLKERLSLREWRDGNEYNEWKDEFIKREERNALKWYGSR